MNTTVKVICMFPWYDRGRIVRPKALLRHTDKGYVFGFESECTEVGRLHLSIDDPMLTEYIVELAEKELGEIPASIFKRRWSKKLTKVHRTDLAIYFSFSAYFDQEWAQLIQYPGQENSQHHLLDQSTLLEIQTHRKALRAAERKGRGVVTPSPYNNLSDDDLEALRLAFKSLVVLEKEREIEVLRREHMREARPRRKSRKKTASHV